MELPLPFLGPDLATRSGTTGKSTSRGALGDGERTMSKFTDRRYRREYYRDAARRAREAELDRVFPDRRCPACGETRTKSRQWVLSSGVCRSCFMSRLGAGA
jgi:hypothetical protein